MGRHNSKSDIPVPVVRIVPVAGGAPHILFIIVERATTQNAAPFLSLPLNAYE
jgi:hypothetical protein